MPVKKDTFEERYFNGWFHHGVGNFTPKDLEISKRWFNGWFKRLDKHIPLQNGKGKRILEIGCSIGGVANLFAERKFDVYASDISAFAVKKAKKLSPHIRFFTIDVQKKITIKEKFDIVVAFEVVEHLEDPQKALLNMYNSLKPNGTLVISSPYPYPWHNDPTHINMKLPAEWVILLKESGFKNIIVDKFSLFPFFYRFHKNFHIIMPFSIPLPIVSNPIFFIGKK